MAASTVSSVYQLSSSVSQLQLSGPPSIHRLPSGSSSSQSQTPSPVPSTALLRGLTENGSATYVSSDNPSLDFFFHVVPDTPHENVTQRLETAWAHDSLTALKLVCNLRGVRGTGKSDKEGFYAAALWLHENHPKTLAANLKAMADFGYFKDLPEILFRLHEGIEIRKQQKNVWQTEKYSYPVDPETGKRVYKKKANTKKETPKRVNTLRTPRGSRRVNSRRADIIQRLNANKAKRGREVSGSGNDVEKPEKKKSRKEKGVEVSKRAFERYANDTEYRNLHDRISEIFAEFLVSDLTHLNAGEMGKISLAAKWCPSLDSSFDTATLLCESIARRIFPRSSCPEYEGVEESHYAYKIRDRLRREYLVPLRKVLELPEVYMSCKMWESVPYNRVSSVAMKNYKRFFGEHDTQRFHQYLESVKKGTTKIAAGALLPHEIIASLNGYGNCTVADMQWKRMVDDMAKIGALSDCLAIADVSESMEFNGDMEGLSQNQNNGGRPIDVAIALGLLVSELSQDPWKGKIISFDKNPRLHVITGNNLRSKTEFIENIGAGETTNLQKVFDHILQVAVDGKLQQDQMIKRLFIFSDMEFDEAAGKQKQYASQKLDSTTDWETDYQVISNKFMERGYNVPEIVFWNLRDSSSTPVLAEQKGVAMVSGFSKNLLKLFLEGSDLEELSSIDLTPVGVMQKAISGEEYSKLVVVD